jgi:hypothetical protein
MVVAALMPGYFGFLANIVTQSYPPSNLITRRTLGWEPAQPGLLADLDNGHYFPASCKVPGYVHARIIEGACLRLPLTRESIGTDSRLISAQATNS